MLLHERANEPITTKCFTWTIDKPGHLAQSETCLTADTCLTTDLGDASMILARLHTFVEIDHEIISTAILLPFADSRRFVVS